MQKNLEDSNGNISNFVLENVNGPIGHHNIANEGVDWEVLGGRYTCKFGECKKSFATKWLLCSHVDKDHFFIMLASRYGRPSIREKGPRCQDHTTMNVRILGNPYKFHKRNEAKAMDRAKKKLQQNLIGCKLKHNVC